MSLKLTASAAAEPVSLSDARHWLRISHDADDALLIKLIRAAREAVEQQTGLALIRQSWTETLDHWPQARLSGCGQAFRLARRPLITVDAVHVRDRSGQLQLWDPAEYRVETGEAARLIALLPFSLPASDRPGGIEIAFTAGFGDAADSVPAPLVEAVLRVLSQSYGADRGEGASSPQDPQIQRLLAPFQRWRL